MKTGFEITQRLEDAKSIARMNLYGVIGDRMDIDSSQVVEAISELEVDRLELYFNSLGGDPMAGFAIANRLAKLQFDKQIKEVHTFAEGTVGSAATIPFLQGSRRTMLNGSRFFIHKGSGTMFISGTEETLPDADSMAVKYDAFVHDLNTTNQEAAELYEAKSTLTGEQVEAAMEAATSYGPREAVEVGFATHRQSAHALAACWDTDRVMMVSPHLDRATVDRLQVLSFEDDPVSQEYASSIRPSNWKNLSQSDIDKALRLR